MSLIFGFDVPSALLLTLILIPVAAAVYLVSVCFMIRRPLETEYNSAILMSENFLPVLRKYEGPRDPQAQNVSPSAEYAVSIARFFVSASAALSEFDNNFPWVTAKVRKAISTAQKDAAVMLRLRDAAAERFFESTDEVALAPTEN